MSEDKLQQQCVMWFRNNYCTKLNDPRYLIYSIPNDGKNQMEQMRKISMGLYTGASDTVLDFGFDLIYCEFKTLDGIQGKNQIDFEQLVTKLGRKYVIIRTIEDFKNLVYDTITTHHS
jgi:hypothetical protein